MSMSKASKANSLLCLTVEVHTGLLNVIFYLKQKHIVGKSTNKSSSDDTCIAGTSLEVEVNFS